MHYQNGQWFCECKHPCSTAIRGRTTYIYENMDLRMFPVIQRGSKEWNSTYKIRPITECAINHFKINMCIAERKTTLPQRPIYSLQDCQPAYCDCCIHNELSTIHSKPQAFNCLKKYSIFIVLIGAY